MLLRIEERLQAKAEALTRHIKDAERRRKLIDALIKTLRPIEVIKRWRE